MGLASALSTALTGMSAAETQIDVAGNNLANSQTVGFKSSKTVFANQFLQTLGIGSSPTSDSGGTNPRQVGLGVQVAQIAQDFSQGTVEISKSPSDLAIQGDAFFIVQGNSGEKLYSRNGIFKTNASNELTNVNGNRLLGFGTDSSFAIERTELKPLTIPLGSAAVAKATETVTLQGVLTPTGDVADTAEVIQSDILGDASTVRPDISASGTAVATAPDVVTAGSAATSAAVGGAALVPGDTYRYKFTFVDNSGQETLGSSELVATVGAGDNAINLTSLPTDALGEYASLNIYRTAAGGSSFFKLANTAAFGGAYTDDGNTPLSATPLSAATINGNYSYLVTFSGAGLQDSRPSVVLGPQNVINGRVLLRNLPQIPAGINPPYTSVSIYRNLSTDTSKFYLVDTIAPGAGRDYTDSKTDATIAANAPLDFDGPRADSNTLLTNLLRRDNLSYEKLFDLGSATSGTLSFAGRKGGRSLEAKELTVTTSTTLQDLINFMDQAMGIRSTSDGGQNLIPTSINTVDGSGNFSPGETINAGRVRFVSNNGTANALSVGLSSFQFLANGTTTTPNLGFGSIQTAKGQSAVADFITYDSLGIPLNVRVTSVLESRDGSSATYRWFADSSQNDPSTGAEIGTGTGLVTFDGNGNMISTTNTTVSIDRRHVPSASPLEFTLDFSGVSGLARDSSSLAAARQDGSPAGTLTNFTIGEDGVIRGQFSNGVSRDLGQIRLARFTNNVGLEQRGQNLFARGVNSGLPIEDDPGQNGTGSIIAGAVELSNTDIGKNLIDLVLASTQYRGNARVITTSQQLLDELLNLRR